MLIEDKMPAKVVLSYEKGSYSYSKIKYSATDEQVYALTKAINSVQSEPVEKVTRVDLKKVTSI